jgi:uncharacterized membrane protein YgdD (TMEM256/DUF423 family)
MNWSAAAAILLGLAVIIGAFGAHGLRGRVDEYSISVYERAVFYHFVHALGLLIVSILPKLGVIKSSAADLTGWLLFAGILLFSGSLYVLAVTGVRALGAVTPFGGICMIGAWLFLAFSLLKRT